MFTTMAMATNSRSTESKEPERRATLLCCVIGSTGLGKSSLIGVYCGRARAGAAAGVHSVTKDSSVFEELGASERVWMDTMGAEDSAALKEGEIDDAIFRGIWQKIFECEPQFMKIVWVVGEEYERMTDTLQKQARFIQTFGRYLPDINVWDSVLIVTRKNNGFEDRIPGVLAAASEFGANRPVRCVGYTCIDWLRGRKRADVLENVQGRSDAWRLRRGVLYEHEIRGVINGGLAGIAQLPLMFERKKCVNCGVVGDPRAVPLKCHDAQEMSHGTDRTSWYHYGSTRSETYVTGTRHAGRLVHHCPRHLSHATTSRKSNSPGSSSTWFTCGYCGSKYNHRFNNIDDDEGSINHCSLCCSDSSHYGGGTWSVGCGGRICNDCIVNRYGCCHEESGSAGCQEKRRSVTKWSCCNKEGAAAQGCKLKHNCCFQDCPGVGCVPRCARCKRRWGNSDGCTVRSDLKRDTGCYHDMVPF